MTKRVVIIGGGAAGPKTAAKLRRQNPDIIIEMYTDEYDISYSACGLPYYISGIIPHIDELLVRSPAQFESRGVRVFLGEKAIKINKENKSVIFKNVKTDEEKDVSKNTTSTATITNTSSALETEQSTNDGSEKSENLLKSIKKHLENSSFSPLSKKDVQESTTTTSSSSSLSKVSFGSSNSKLNVN